ncbi:ribonuclease PH [Alphaproteobacteria bacterium]|nr:ribonuclease PH [Alphaproteobacteria bacterium]GHS96685.1 ribonuclease PH [Alphaproteobacteria bacterium]
MARRTRRNDELRPLFLGPGFMKNAQGSCFVKMGDTHVICTATVDEKVPSFLRNTGKGWITAEYGMLPGCSNERIEREAVKGKQSGRTQEIQRLIGRALRAAVDLETLGERQIKIDCDVIQADGGTRTASITGGFIALSQALQKLQARRKISQNPILCNVAAISCGVVDGVPLLDLEYLEDSQADVDANFVLDHQGNLIEVQMTSEKKPVPRKILDQLTDLATKGIQDIFAAQKDIFPNFA